MPDNEQTPQDQQKPMVDVTEWSKKFQASEKIMKSQFKYKWNIARRRIRAEYDVKNRKSAKMTHNSVPLAYSIGQSFVSSVYFKAPNCNLTAREEVLHDQIENTEVKVNDWLKDKKAKNVVKRNTWDAYNGGFGARFIDYEYDDMEDPNNILDPGSPEIPEQIDQLTGQLIPAQPARPPQYGRIVLKNEITIQRIRPDLVRFPKGFDFDNYQDSQWIGFDIITPLDEVKNNQDWDESVRNAIEGDKYSKLSDGDKDETNEDDDTLYAKISYAFEHPKDALSPFKLLIFCDKNKTAPLAYEDYDKGHVGYPIKFIYFNPLDDDCSYPNGDVWNIESFLSAVDTWWRKMLFHVERSNPKRVYDSGSISQQEVQKLKGNNDLEWVGITNKQRQPIPNLIQTLEAAQLNPSVDKFYEVSRQLLSEVSPRSGLSRGAQDNNVDTATEAKIMNMGEVIDIESRIDVEADYIKDIVLDVAGILEKSLQGTVPIKREIADPDTQQMVEQIIPVDKSGFTSKIEVDVDVESMQSQNKDVLFKQLLELLGILSKLEPILNKPSIDPETGMIKNGKTIDIEWWLERILETRNIRNIEEGIKEIPPAPVVLPDGEPGSGALPSVPSGEGNNEMVQEDMTAAQV